MDSKCPIHAVTTAEPAAPAAHRAIAQGRRSKAAPDDWKCWRMRRHDNTPQQCLRRSWLWHATSTTTRWYQRWERAPTRTCDQFQTSAWRPTRPHRIECDGPVRRSRRASVLVVDDTGRQPSPAVGPARVSEDTTCRRVYEWPPGAAGRGTRPRRPDPALGTSPCREMDGLEVWRLRETESSRDAAVIFLMAYRHRRQGARGRSRPGASITSPSRFSSRKSSRAGSRRTTRTVSWRGRAMPIFRSSCATTSSTTCGCR